MNFKTVITSIAWIVIVQAGAWAQTSPAYRKDAKVVIASLQHIVDDAKKNDHDSFPRSCEAYKAKLRDFTGKYQSYKITVKNQSRAPLSAAFIPLTGATVSLKCASHFLGAMQSDPGKKKEAAQALPEAQKLIVDLGRKVDSGD